MATVTMYPPPGVVSATGIVTRTVYRVPSQQSLNQAVTVDTRDEGGLLATGWTFVSFGSQSNSAQVQYANGQSTGVLLDPVSGLPVGVTSNAETATLYSNIVAAGGTLSASSYQAIDAFVWQGKRDGWWALLDNVCVFAGSTIAAALLYLKSSGGPSSMINNGVGAQYYAENAGLGSNTSMGATAYIDTGVNPAQMGRTTTNFSWGLWANFDGQASEAGFAAGLPATGNARLAIDQTVMGQASNGPSITGPFGSKSFKAISFTPTQCLTNENGVDHTFASNNATFDPTAELAIFSSKVNGTQLYNSGGLIGLFFTGQALTAAQMQSLGNANTLLQKRLGRLSAQHPTLALLGDSLTGGQGPTTLTSTWRRIVPLLTSKTELNFGVPSSRVSNHGDTYQAFILRYLEVIAAGPDEAQIIGGTNDLNLDPLATTTGTGATITQFQADLTTIYTAFQNAGIPVTATTIPYVLSSTGWGAAALAAYQAAIVAAVQAAPNPIRFVDLYAVFKALGTTAADALMGGIHPLNSGSILVANTLAKAYNTGFYDIDFSLSPGAISANSSVTVTTDSFGAALTVANVLPVTAGGSGTRVSVTPPAGLNAGVIVRVVVSAAGALNFIFDNITGGAITPTAGLIYKTSVSCYN